MLRLAEKRTLISFPGGWSTEKYKLTKERKGAIEGQLASVVRGALKKGGTSIDRGRTFDIFAHRGGLPFFVAGEELEWGQVERGE